jgi:hypothetical protein
LRGVAPGASITHVRTTRVSRLFSVNQIDPPVVHSGPRDVLKTELRLRQFIGRRCKWSVDHQHAIAEFGFGFRIAAIERFGVDECGGLRRMPLPVARARQHAAASEIVCHRQIGDHLHEIAAAIPDLARLRESLIRQDPRERTLHARHERVVAIRRDGEVAVHRRAADRRPLTGGGVDGCQLAGAVVLEQVFIVHAGKHVLHGRRGRGDAAALLNVWTGRHCRRFGLWSASGVDERAQQRFAITGPRARLAEYGVQLRRRHRFGLAGRRVADPQLDAVVADVGESESFAVGIETNPFDLR